MKPLDQLNSYLQRLESRLRLRAFSRGTSLVTVSALLITVFLVWIINRYAFSPASLFWARVLLFISVGTAIAFGLVIPLMRLNRRNAARRAESEFPEFQERLLTLAEKPESDPFLQLLASDAMRVAENCQPDRVAPAGPIFGFLTSAGLAGAVLLWLILAGPGYIGYGTSLLWAGAPHTGGGAFYDITVTPGDRTVRRKSDQLITAQLRGFDAPKVRLFAQYKGSSKWEPVDMLPSPGASTYEFLITGIPDNVEYYVEAGAVDSKHYTLRVIDLPAIKKIRVTYHFPSWAGMKELVEDPGGDLRAVEGTVAEVAVQTDRPLAKGVLMLSDDQQIPLQAGEGNWLTGKVTIQKDGMYHVAAIENGENVRMSEDFFIEARKYDPPTVKITRPGRDVKVNPIEEVTMTVTAADDFGLSGVDLHYSVNGGAEKTVSVLSQKGAKTSEGNYVIALEDYKMSPGDLVSVYATAHDARNTSKTDMYFIQAEPFERNYSQSQEAGGGGGGGQQGDNPASEISQRQKDIIAATWNELKNGGKSNAGDDAKFLGDLEDKLAAQAKSLVERAKARGLDSASPEMQSFAKNLEQASVDMTESAKKLRAQKWNDALVPEQQGLQHALRAEDSFRDIQVAFGSRGNGGGQGGMGRDLENLADLELDREKNQYETGQQSASDSRAKEIDNALQKLADLARRQQELANKKDPQQSFRQRWEQEMLRREAEELKRQMEQLSRGNSSQQQASSSQQGQPGQQGQQSSQQSKSGQQGQQSRQQNSGQTGSVADPRLEQALERLKRATDDMRDAASPQSNNQDQTSAGQKRAADRLQEARDILKGMQHQNASQSLDDMVKQAQQLAEHQSDYQNRLKQMFQGSQGSPLGQQPGQSRQEADKMASEKEQMADQLKQLEKQMGESARSLAGAQNPVSTKLRDALSEAQQNELELRMRKGAEWLRQGQGMYTWLRENTVTMGVDQLRDKLQQAQAAVQQQGQGKGEGDKADIEKALSRMEAMRNRMQQLAQGQQKPGKGGQPGQNQGQQGKPGQAQAGQQPNGQQPGGQQPGGQQPGQQQAGQPGGQQNGQQPGGQQAGNQGQPGQPGSQPGVSQSYSPQSGREYGPGGGLGPIQPHNGQIGDAPIPASEAFRQSQQDLNQLRDFMKEHPEFAGDMLQLMHALNPAYSNDAELSQRINKEVLPGIERLELELRRKLDESAAGQVRSAGSEKVPAGYSDAIAEYFRKLSKGK